MTRSNNNTATGERLNAVTGAFGFTGKYIASQLLRAGERVRTLTAHPDAEDLPEGRVEVAPLQFARPSDLAESLRGAATLYNTYWVRFDHGMATHDEAIRNTATLVRAAEEAGVRRIVHISVSNPSPESPLPYFRGKAEVEAIIRSSRLSWAILRPALIFGVEDILINNIAWMLRTFPVFAIPGSGEYRVQPVFVGDLSALAVQAGHKDDNLVQDAVGPEVYPYEELVRVVATAIGSRARIMHVPPGVFSVASRVVGRLVNDVVLTRDEVSALMADLLVSHEEPTAPTGLRAWLAEHADRIGVTYASELARHYVPVRQRALTG